MDRDTIYCAHQYGYTITLSEKGCYTWYMATDTLLHEWAHMLQGDNTAHHGVEWAVHYAKIYEAFHDNGGCQRSKSY